MARKVRGEIDLDSAGNSVAQEKGVTASFLADRFSPECERDRTA
jgi:hypothetical protein